MKDLEEVLRDIEQYGKLRDVLYTVHGTGGKLHVVTDDGNIEDNFLRLCKEDVESGDEELYLKHVQLAMLALLAKYPEYSNERDSIDMGCYVEITVS